MKPRIIGILMVAVVVLNGCAQTKIVEDLGIINIYGIDTPERDQVDTTAVYYKFGSKSKGLKRIDAGSGKTLGDAQNQMNYKRGYQLDAGSIQLELFGKKTAKEGLIQHLRSAVRGAKRSDTRILAVSDTTANDLITRSHHSERVSVEHTLNDIIDLNVKQDVLPNTKLHDFLRWYYDPGLDPVLPILSFQHDVPKLTSLALFKGDQLTGQIPIDQAFFINMFHKNINEVELEFPLPVKPFKKYFRDKPEAEKDYFYTQVRVKKGKSNTKLIDRPAQHYQTKLDFEVDVREITEDLDLQNETAANLYTKELEKTIKQQYEQLLTRLQKLNTDPFGYGQIYKTKKRDGTLTDSEWRDIFPDITVDVDVNVDMVNQGVTP